MGKLDIAKGQILYKKGAPVNDVAIILKGSFTLTDETGVRLSAGNGSILGAFHPSGSNYRYNFQAAEDSTLFVYDYTDEDDLENAIKATPTIAPVMVSASINLLNNLADTLSELYEAGGQLCRGTQANYNDYKNICARLMIMPQQFEGINVLVPPEKPDILNSWQVDLCRACLDKNDLLRKEFYPADIRFCVGTIMLAAQLAQNIQREIDKLQAFIQQLKDDTDEFNREYHSQKAKFDDAQRQEAMESGSGNLPQIKNALTTILAFAEIDRSLGDAFGRDIRAFMQAPDKAEKSTEMRRLRGDITNNFYTIYEAAFFKSLTAEDVPAEVKMFLLFGFVDEELAGEDNTAELYKYTILWEDDPQGRVLPACHWLKKIYNGEVPPSKDEFDNDWPDHLKEEVRQGNLTQEQADAMLEDRKAMTTFELHNMITGANKMTYGSIFSFIPAFYAQSVNRPLENCLVTTQRATEELNHIRDLDFGCFYRPAYASYPQLKINRFDYHEEILPYIILMPNYGSRGVMWQEIEGRKRTTPAHLVISILHSEDLFSTLIRMCAQFRWEMCKRIQGVHYSDITDPSLTSEYVNYLQFYKKNSSLSADMKEKVKSSLKRNNNSYGNVFASEYELFLKCESEGLPRLNKVSREILFKYCTFSQKYRDNLMINPQYKPLIERWHIGRDDRARTLELFSRKILTQTKELPEEVQLEAEYLNR
ncbi:MAG: hypothetical protein K6F95_08965 [Selenomonas sp.]|uniref:hypothetical protein n=1 Tax=Selenomonas sp. TaxID=2053611 RepID=UPI0025D168B4|nr:hypothetical protein [Selenomonas sp.]MCR5758021.1 hypothetical protein [Selenomonas sp.]